MTNMDYYYAGKAFAPEKQTLTAEELFDAVLDAAQGDDTMPAPWPCLADYLPFVTCYAATMAKAVMKNTALEFRQNGISNDGVFVQTVLYRCAWAGIAAAYLWHDDTEGKYTAACRPDTEDFYYSIMQGQPIGRIPTVAANIYMPDLFQNRGVNAVSDYLQNAGSFAYGAACVRFRYGNHPEIPAYCAMYLYGIAFGLTVTGLEKPDSFRCVQLTVDGQDRGSFLTPGMAQEERSFCTVPDYAGLYRSIGLGAPVTATVSAIKNGELVYDHSFSYTLAGNSVSFSDFKEEFNSFHDCCTIEELNQREDVIRLLCSFPSGAKTHEMVQAFTGIANIGAREWQDPDSGKYLVQVEFYPQPGLENGC